MLVDIRTVPLAHALGAHSVVAARDTTEESVQDLDESGPYQAFILQLQNVFLSDLLVLWIRIVFCQVPYGIKISVLQFCLPDPDPSLLVRIRFLPSTRKKIKKNLNS